MYGKGMAYEWNMYGIRMECLSNTHGMHNMEYACNMQGICMEYAWDMHEICKEYAWSMPVIHMEYVCNMPGVYLAYAWNMRRICMEYVSDMHGSHARNMYGLRMEYT